MIPSDSFVGDRIVADRIAADPQADTLRPIWTVRADSIGFYITGLGDIFETGRGTWAVYSWSLEEWRLFRHDSGTLAADTIPFTTFRGYDRYPLPVTGNFWGAGRKGLLLSQSIDDTVESIYTQKIHAFRIGSDGIDDHPATTMSTWDLLIDVPWMNNIAAADLDADGADEAILMMSRTLSDTGDNYAPEIWIFKGGADFSLVTPTIVLRAEEDFGAISHVEVGDFDGDRHQDIVMTKSRTLDTSYPRRIYFYWGTGDLEGFRDARNRRMVEFGVNHPMYYYPATTLDCDGDGIRDLAFSHRTRYDEDKSTDGMYIYRSGPDGGRNARTRSFARDDADIRLFASSYLWMQPGGYLNDRSRRFDMLAMMKHTPGNDPHASVVLFSGGSDGPDTTYEAYINRPTSILYPTLDVDGDGWDDLLATDYPDGSGVAPQGVIYAGGPWIPSPKLSGVEVIAAQGHKQMHQQGITIWPNPVADELLIAWRGDLQRVPHSFRVQDTYGREVARGDVRAGKGRVTWRCADLPSGVYLVSITDEDGTLIATRAIVKQE